MVYRYFDISFWYDKRQIDKIAQFSFVQSTPNRCENFDANSGCISKEVGLISC